MSDIIVAVAVLLIQASGVARKSGWGLSLLPLPCPLLLPLLSYFFPPLLSPPSFPLPLEIDPILHNKVRTNLRRGKTKFLAKKSVHGPLGV